MTRVLVTPHPCAYCGKLTSNRRCCSRECNGKMHVSEWNGSPHSAESKAKMSVSQRFPKPWMRERGLQNLIKIQSKHPPKETRACRQCGKVFQVPPSNPRVFCSRDCYLARRVTICAQCGREFSDKARHTRKFCSILCLHASRRGVPTARQKQGEQSSGVSGYRPDLRLFVRSRWEANYARILHSTGQAFAYEPNRFPVKLPDGRLSTYCPDFLVGERYIEIKGWWRPGDAEKVSAFRQQYPGLSLDVVDSTDYQRIEGEYGSAVKGWEWPSSDVPGSTERLCKSCGAVLVNKRQFARFCSRTCASLGHSKPRETRLCRRCGQPFTIISDSRNEREQARAYCSHSCAVHDNMLVALSARWPTQKNSGKA